MLSDVKKNVRSSVRTVWTDSLPIPDQMSEWRSQIEFPEIGKAVLVSPCDSVVLMELWVEKTFTFEAVP
jgi:hypothetical protein